MESWIKDSDESAAQGGSKVQRGKEPKGTNGSSILSLMVPGAFQSEAYTPKTLALHIFIFLLKLDEAPSRV